MKKKWTRGWRLKGLATVLLAVGLANLGGAQMVDNPNADAASVPSSYNLKVGGLYLRTGAGVNFAYNDNISLRESNEEEDFIFTPHVNFGLYMPLTKRNAFKFAFDVGGEFYADHDEYNNFTIFENGGNELELYAQTDNWEFRLRDQYSLVLSPLVNSRSTGDTDVTRFNNVVSLSADADYDRLVGGASYTHTTELFWGGNDEFDYLDRNNDSFRFNIGTRVSSPLILGVEYGLNINYYDDDDLNNSLGHNASGYAQFVLTRNINGRASVGYGWTDYDGGGRFNDYSSYGDLIFSFNLTHEINKFARHTFTATKDVNPGITSNYEDTFDLTYNMSFDLSRYWTVDLLVAWTTYDSSESDISEDADLVRVQMGTAYQLTKSINMTLRYEFITKDSNLEQQSFDQNKVTLGFNYAF